MDSQAWTSTIYLDTLVIGISVQLVQKNPPPSPPLILWVGGGVIPSRTHSSFPPSFRCRRYSSRQLWNDVRGSVGSRGPVCPGVRVSGLARAVLPSNEPVQGLRQCGHYASGTGSCKSYSPTCFNSMLRASGSQGLCGLSLMYAQGIVFTSTVVVAQVLVCTLSILWQL